MHRDLKPSNIFIRDSLDFDKLSVYIGDFDISKIIE
jgi:serine/threonine protein kinase